MSEILTRDILIWILGSIFGFGVCKIFELRTRKSRLINLEEIDLNPVIKENKELKLEKSRRESDWINNTLKSIEKESKQKQEVNGLRKELSETFKKLYECRKKMAEENQFEKMRDM